MFKFLRRVFGGSSGPRTIDEAVAQVQEALANPNSTMALFNVEEQVIAQQQVDALTDEQLDVLKHRSRIMYQLWQERQDRKKVAEIVVDIVDVPSDTEST